MQKEVIYHRWAASLGGGFAGDAKSAWGTRPYNPIRHNTEPTVFCGLYGLPDFIELWRHRGKKWIWWAGSDVTHLLNGYWLDTRGDIRLDPKPLAKWIQKNCESWVENTLLQKELASIGIKAKVCPSYLGDVTKIKPSYKPSDRPKAYISVSGDDFDAYGWDRIDEMAEMNPHVTFYCYGNNKPWKSQYKNVVVRGRVPQKTMDSEIKDMQMGIRLNKHDGFSEILAKAVLMEHDVISTIDYPFLKMDRKKARQWLLKNVNKYPWA